MTTAGGSRAAWLFDIGSTFTKLTVVDAATGRRLGSVQSATTVLTDVREGMQLAIGAMEDAAGVRFADAALRRASSSAAGGLALVVSGLVPRLSLEAGRIASLGAGAKLVGSWGYRLTRADLAQLSAVKPDVILLTGGTDGGDRENILSNARALAGVRPAATIVVAGNRDATDEAVDILTAAGCSVRCAPNILPEVERVDVEPVRSLIRDIFLEEIVQAKGIDKAAEMLDGPILPTPFVVLQAVERLATEVLGCDAVAIEVGGATTNVHSFAEGAPREATTMLRGFVEPRLKRTVEGDLGVRYNADTIVQSAGLGSLAAGVRGLSQDRLASYVAELRADPSRLPSDEQERAADEALAVYAVRRAITRHCGRLEQVFLPSGVRYIQHGKDLRDVPAILFTGGPLINARDPGSLLGRVIEQPDPLALTPQRPRAYLDRNYVLYAAGLLVVAGQARPAATMLRESLVEFPVLTAGTELHHADA